MTSTNRVEWSKELRILLDRIQSRPSEDWSGERQRVVVLNRLLGQSDKAQA